MENIFENFAGADLDRLTDCIKEVRKAGLTIDKYCHAGVNQSSGNVYIWSDDWPGCVYCSICFDVAWSYSCGECGNEVDLDSYKELCEYAELCFKHDQHCENCAENWVIED